jgi:hypothetical protein
VKELKLKEKQFDGQQREPESRKKYIDDREKESGKCSYSSTLLKEFHYNCST